MYEFKNYYFLGIGGIGMSALARYFFQLGKSVSGYNNISNNITNILCKEGITVSFLDDIEILPKNINPQNTLIVYTPAIPENLFLKQYFIKNKFKVYKRSKVLGLITQKSICLAIAGTHGKTTTTGILSHIFMISNQNFYAFLGGILENYQSNFLSHGDKISIVEADEFDRSFLNLFPSYGIITSNNIDHLDIYKDPKAVKKAFQDFADLIPKNKKIFINNDINIKGSNIYKYSIYNICDYYASNIRRKKFKIYFDFNFPGGQYSNMELNLPGNHNLENTIAALSLANEFKINEKLLRDSLRSFKGIKRRFSIFQFKNSKKYYIDDYAHHPHEIKTILQEINRIFKKEKKLIIFQPHLFSRTRDCMEEFSNSFENISELILLDIYPARELPIKGINSKVLLDKIKLKNKSLSSLDKIIEIIKYKKFDIIVTLGAGDIDTLSEKIKLIYF